MEPVPRLARKIEVVTKRKWMTRTVVSLLLSVWFVGFSTVMLLNDVQSL